MLHLHREPLLLPLRYSLPALRWLRLPLLLPPRMRQLHRLALPVRLPVGFELVSGRQLIVLRFRLLSQD